MAFFAPDRATLANLEGKVVVLTGGGKGIGAAMVGLFYEAKARVVFGDWDSASGEEVASKYPERVHFLKINVCEYHDILALFATALAKYGRVDHALSNAGVSEQENWFDPNLTVESVQIVPDQTTLDVNLLGALYFARIAVPYLRHGSKEREDKSITLLSSVAGFKESPGLFLYSTAKHGVMGLGRALRAYLPGICGIRVNTICPFMTATPMTSGIQDAWTRAQLPVNQAADVGKVCVEVVRSTGLNGKAFHVSGGSAWEFEANLDRLQPEWLGEEQSALLNKGQEVYGKFMNGIANEQR